MLKYLLIFLFFILYLKILHLDCNLWNQGGKLVFRVCFFKGYGYWIEIIRLMLVYLYRWICVISRLRIILKFLLFVSLLLLRTSLLVFYGAFFFGVSVRFLTYWYLIILDRISRLLSIITIVIRWVLRRGELGFICRGFLIDLAYLLLCVGELICYLVCFYQYL